MRFLLNTARRPVASNYTATANRRTNKSLVKSTTKPDACSRDTILSINHPAVVVNESNHTGSLTKSWGQQCSPDCGCVVRFEAKVDHRQRIVHCDYVAKSVVTTIDEENGGRLKPVYTTRMSRPMFQECKCESVHVLAKRVTSYLPNKRWSDIKGMNDFAFTRSSLAFRHAVLAENELPRSDTHCFDVVEEAFTGMVNGRVPSKRRIDAPFEKVFAAGCLQLPSVVHFRTTRNYEEKDRSKQQQRSQRGESDFGLVNVKLGVDRNRLHMSTSQTISTLGMFDMNAENWLDEEDSDSGEYSKKSNNSDQFDWVSYVDDLQSVDDSAY
mmetsp:Transcript_24218/g.67084  ORF Transcript_24218/g.67084 Transcript_24218/m.67084 type:complete len:326 (+) Transcript_24218:338-1315(+)